jgi:rubredoxin
MNKKKVKSMTHWKCSNCDYTFETDVPPDNCPSCKQACTFSDVTCYTPECGGPGNIDPRLVGKKEKPIND